MGWFVIGGQVGPNKDGSAGYANFSETFADNIKDNVERATKDIADESRRDAYRQYIEHALKPMTVVPDAVNVDYTAIGLDELRKAREKLVEKL